MLSLLRCVCEKVFATSAQTSVCADSDCRGMSVPRLRTSGYSHVCMQMSTHRDFHNYSLSGSILSHFVFGLGTACNSSFQNLSGKSAATSKARVKCHPFLPVIFSFLFSPLCTLSFYLSQCHHCTGPQKSTLDPWPHLGVVRTCTVQPCLSRSKFQ